MSLSAILLDVDGTIANTEELHRCSYNYAFNYYNLNWEWGDSLYNELLMITGGKERIRYFIKKFEVALPSHINTDINTFISQIHQIKTRQYLKLLKSSAIEPRSGIKELVLEAKSKNIKIGIVTTTSKVNVDALLKRFFGKDLSVYFDAFCTGDNIQHKKPAPDLYLEALDKLSLPACKCLAIEDSRNGLISSITAQIPTIITINKYTKNEDFKEAKLVINQLGTPLNPFTVIKGELGQYKYINLKALNYFLKKYSS